MAKALAKTKSTKTAHVKPGPVAVPKPPVKEVKETPVVAVQRGRTDLDLDHYREILQEKADEIKRSMSTPAAAETLVRREEPNDYVDLAGQSHEEWIFLNRNAQNASLLRQVEEAQERIDDGMYGVCLECGQPISQKRLEAVPWATFCISCQEKRGSWTN